VVLPLYDGEVGILRGHAPMIGRLGFGVMRLTTEKGPLEYYVDGGFVQVADNVVNVMTSRALAPEELDADAASESLSKSLAQPAKGDEGIAARQRQVDQARAQIRFAKKPR
jgi:F-type H+-transporting ATPase subunit epsilon